MSCAVSRANPCGQPEAAYSLLSQTNHMTDLTYAAALRTADILSAFVPASLGRLNYGIVPLALLLSVQDATSSFTTAATTCAIFGLAALSMPVKARMVDRRGQRSVLPLLGLTYACVLLGFVSLTSLSVRLPAAYFLCAVMAGLAAPPIGPSMRTLWLRTFPATEDQTKVLSLDQTIEGFLGVLGPVLVGGFTAFGGPDLAIVCGALLAGIGTVGLGTSRLARRTPPPQKGATLPRRLGGTVSLPGFRNILGAMLCVGLALGFLEIAIAAKVVRSANAPSAGILFGVLAAGSLAGGLLWGKRRHSHSHRVQIVILLTIMAAGCSLVTISTGLPSLSVALFMTGLSISPAYIVAYSAVGHLVPPRLSTEASTWVNTTNNAGGALGSAAAGYSVDHLTLPVSSVAAALLLLATALFWPKRAYLSRRVTFQSGTTARS